MAKGLPIPDWVIDLFYTGANALVFFVLLAYAIRTRPWRQAESIPVVGIVPRGIHAGMSVVGKVA